MKATISNDLAIATNVANEFEKLGGMQEVEKLEAAGCGNCGVNIVNGICQCLPYPINLLRCYCDCSCGACCLCIEATQNYIDDCTLETISDASAAIVLPVVVSVAGKYIDIPEEIKEQAKPPTGETLLRIKGILPSCVADAVIPDPDKQVTSDLLDEDGDLEWLQKNYVVSRFKANYSDDGSSKENETKSPSKANPDESASKKIPRREMKKIIKEKSDQLKAFQADPFSLVGSQITCNDGRIYDVKSFSIDDHTQKDNFIYELVEANVSSVPADYDPNSLLSINRLEAYCIEDPQYISIDESSKDKAPNYNQQWDLSLTITQEAVSDDKTPKNGLSHSALFDSSKGLLGFLSDSDNLTEILSMNFWISVEDLENWESTTPVTTIDKKEQENVRRVTLDNPLNLLGYELKFDEGELADPASRKSKKKSIFSSMKEKAIDFNYIVCSYTITSVVATNFRHCKPNCDKSKLQTELHVKSAKGFKENDKILINRNVVTIASIKRNVITIQGDGIKVPPLNSIVRKVISTELTDAIDENSDQLSVADVRGFYIGMPVKIGNGTQSEKATIQSIDAPEFECTEADPQPGTITLDTYLKKSYAQGSYVRDNLKPMDKINLYTLAKKKTKGLFGNSDFTYYEHSLKNAVRIDSQAFGLSYFVGEKGLDDFNIYSDIVYRKKYPLIKPEPETDEEPYKMQCFCIGCDPDDAELALELEEAKLLGTKAPKKPGAAKAPKKAAAKK